MSHTTKTDSKCDWVRGCRVMTDEYHRGVIKTRPSVADYLKAQHTKNMLERMPRFERDTKVTIEALRQEIRNLRLKLMVLSWVVAAGVFIFMFTVVLSIR